MWRGLASRASVIAVTLAAMAIVAAPAAGATTTACAPASAAPGASIPGVQSAQLGLPGRPDASATTADGLHTFVALDGEPTTTTTQSPFAILGALLAPQSESLSPGSFAIVGGEGRDARLLRTVALPAQPRGLVLGHDGRSLLVAAGGSVLVYDVGSLLAGDSEPAGRLVDGALATDQLALSTDDGYAFVGDPTEGAVSVYNLAAARTSGYRTSAVIGRVPVGAAVGGLALSPDGRLLYAVTGDTLRAAGDAAQPGSLIAIDVPVASRDPAHAIVASAPAGCSPARVAVTADGTQAWVTAAGDDSVRGYDTGALLDGEGAHAQDANVRVGATPVGLALADDGDLALVADASLSQSGQAGVTLVDTAAALTGGTSALGTLPGGDEPLEAGISPDGSEAAISDWSGSTLRLLDAGTLPEPTTAAAPQLPRLVLRITPRRLRVGVRTRLHLVVEQIGGGAPITVGGASVRIGRLGTHVGRGGTGTLMVTLARPGSYLAIASYRGYASSTLLLRALAPQRRRAARGRRRPPQRSAGRHD